MLYLLTMTLMTLTASGAAASSCRKAKLISTCVRERVWVCECYLAEDKQCLTDSQWVAVGDLLTDRQSDRQTDWQTGRLSSQGLRRPFPWLSCSFFIHSLNSFVC